MSVRLEQFWKVSDLIVETELGIWILIRPVQPRNARLLMVVTELGIWMLVRLVHPSNAPFPIVVTELGISTYVRLVQSWYAYCAY
jgi:hypothetical protein